MNLDSKLSFVEKLILTHRNLGTINETFFQYVFSVFQFTFVYLKPTKRLMV